VTTIDLDATCRCGHRRRVHWLAGEMDDVTEPAQRPSLAVCDLCRLDAQTREDMVGFHAFEPARA